MAKRRELTIPCAACGGLTPVSGPLAGDRMQVRCVHCGYTVNLSVKHLRETHGAEEYVDGTWWTTR